MLIFKDNNKDFDNNIFVVDEFGESLTYRDLKLLSLQFKNHLKPRSLIFCLCENNLESLVGYISFINNAVVPLMIDSAIDFKLLKELTNKYLPKYFWLDSRKLDFFPKSKKLFSYKNYCLIELKNKVEYKLCNNLALLLTTSGSTGSPKLVKLSYENLISNAESICRYLKIDKYEKPITILPIYYSFGISIINSHILKGAKILLTSKSILQKEFWNFLKKQKATSISGVPYTFEILKKIRFFSMDLPFIKTITQAGGKINEDLNKNISVFCKKNNKKFFVMYGQTEASPRMSYLPHEFSLSKIGSIGKAIPGGKFELIDENKKIINKTNSPGELVYYGKNVFLGYSKKGDDLIKSDENNNKLFTGDIAKIDKDGFYYVIGRKKRFIKVFGHRINLDDLERVLKNIDNNCVCSGYDDNLFVYTLFKDKVKLLSDFIISNIGINKQAFNILVIKKIPKNNYGKIIYSKLRV